MTVAELLKKHPDVLQLAFSVHPETGDRDLHVWVADHVAGHDHADPHLWQSTSCDMMVLEDPGLRADVQALYVELKLAEATSNLIWFRTVEES